MICASVLKNLFCVQLLRILYFTLLALAGSVKTLNTDVAQVQLTVLNKQKPKSH